MTVIDPPIPVPAPPIAAPSLPVCEADVLLTRRHRWTAEEYMKLGDRDVFSHDTELIAGEVYDVPSQKNRHVAGISKTNRVITATFDETFWVTVQSTIRLKTGDIPDPDFAVRPGPVSSDDSVHPMPLLVIEVSDTTLLFDQVVKGGMYAASGVADYWIINVNAGQLEVYRRPVVDASRMHGWRYADLTILRPPATVSPLAMPSAVIDVAKLLP